MSEFRRRLLRRQTVSAFLQSRGFQPVEYLKGDRDDYVYIMTNVRITSDDFEVEFVASIYQSLTQNTIIGTWGSRVFVIGLSQSGFAVNTDETYIYTSQTIGYNEAHHYRVIAQNNSAQLYRDGVLLASRVYEGSIVSNYPISIFRTSYAYRGSYQIYEVIFRVAGRKTNHFFPCRRLSDNKPGLYDIVDDVFYQNQPYSGQFSVGPDVEINESI